MNEAVGAIDLGTNTARLLIGSCHKGKIDQQFIMRRITRLGGGFSSETGISDEARHRSLQTMQEFAIKLREYGVKRLRAVATSAVRDAANGDLFCREVLQETGINLEVIDGDCEGVLTLRGVMAGLDNVPENLLVFDVGGGSTEYTLARGGDSLFCVSLPLGVVRLTEGKPDMAAMADKIDRELSRLKKMLIGNGLLDAAKGAVTVGTAGTATTLAAISMKMSDYDYRKVNNYCVSLDEIESIFSLLLPMSPENRLKVPGMEKGREDLIIAGTLLTLKTLACFGSGMLKVSDFGLLEGVLLSVCDNS
ncbi:bifunctional 3-dehydroquinate synthase/phosphatase [Geobacter sp. OR-1]|uniref:Ppx/GppA phosphatase family protein n=1 Tax=Geobacter sp. OR-1 TaxID=1266765 RepID=UPI000541CC17|nr:exopolyphosphatase [Geobacter sp. OR-1]GAM11566.1 bifunctional 3-dehydroquinate synthase/phosphatase [Geobacter sp. OR-1]